MRGERFVIGALLCAVGLLCGGCESSLKPPHADENAPVGAAYVGSARCAVCHADVGNQHARSGHAWILNRVVEALPPDYPFRDEVGFPLTAPPPGRAWSDIAYVVGGFGWKAQFVGTDGRLVTGDETQYDLETGEWVSYRSGETPEYDCARCHTTGYMPDGHQQGRAGITGTWQEDGVGCEACHGPGARHVESRSAADITVTTDVALCAPCHSRNVGGPVLAEPPDGEGDQFVRNYSQYDELQGRNESGVVTGPHAGFNCVSCHDPHVSSHFEADRGGVVVDCASCHSTLRVNIPGGGAHTCVNCHMPWAARSAVKRTPYEADVRVHLFRIEADAQAEMFYESGGNWLARPFITLDFACLRCHTGRDLDWAAQWAGAIHAGSDVQTAWGF
jgi:hypothetical protein